MHKEITRSEPQRGAGQWNPSGNGREVTRHLFPKKLSDYYQDAGLLFLLRSYCGGGSGLLNTRGALLKETQLQGLSVSGLGQQRKQTLAPVTVPIRARVWETSGLYMVETVRRVS